MPNPPQPPSPADDAGDRTDASGGAVAVASEAKTPRALSGRLAGMSLGRQVFVLALWPFLQQLLNWSVSFVDTAVAGHTTAAATGAIAVGGYVNWFMGMMVMGIGAGGAALIARAVGGGHRGLANAGVGQTLLLGTLTSLAVAFIVIALAHPVGWAAGLRGEALALCRVYLWITAGGLPLAAILFVSVSCMTAAGDTRSPFLIMVVMNAVNLGATLFLAIRMDLGVTGIALGTVVGWGTGAIAITLRLLKNRNGSIRLHPHRLRPHWHTIQRIWRVAYPNLLDRGGHWAGNWIVIMIVGEIGRRALAADTIQGAHIIAIRIEAISFLPALAFAAAASTLTGQYLGANDPAMARRAARFCWFLGAGLMFALGLVFVAIPELLVRSLTDLPELLALAPPLVRLCGYVQFFFGSALVLQGAMRGAGDTRVPAILSNALTWGFRLPLAAIFGLWLGWGLYGIWVALCTELFLRGCVFIARYKGDGWLKVKV
ncbi:MAG: MATE family efflux transporter [Planctomycetota bacterium]